ncbi:MAG: hypothetical protein EOP48_12870 [Sphingobacteriales bacterium]|nr:MAG: hypothetical protein EOP48_12870 [Sphingobacteriales bacterium]
MKTLYLINFCLIAKIAFKKDNSLEKGTAYVTSTEIFFSCLGIGCLILKLLPFKVHDYVIYGLMSIIGYLCFYPLCKFVTGTIVGSTIRISYSKLIKKQRQLFFLAGILIFYGVFLGFLALGFATIYGYDNKWH